MPLVFRLPVLMAYLAVLFQLAKLPASPAAYAGSLVAECVQDAHARGAPGGPGAGQDADDGRDDEARDERAPRDREHEPLARESLVTIQPKTTPMTRPSRLPITAVMALSKRIVRRSWRRVMPIARSMPISRVRSCTDSSSVLTMPNSEISTLTPSSA